MAIDIDGYAVLGAIARKPEAFLAIKNEVSKVARTLVVKQLKEKALPVQGLREIADAIDHEAFGLVLDMMTDAEINSLVGKIDKSNVEAKGETPQWQRKHLLELANGTVLPAVKKAVTKAPPKAKPKPDAVERAGSARFAKAKRRG